MTGSRSIRMHVTLAALAGVLLLLGVFAIARTASSGGDSADSGGYRPDAAGSGVASEGQSGANASGEVGQGSSGGGSADGGGSGGGSSTSGGGGGRPGSVRLPGATLDNSYPLDGYPSYTPPPGDTEAGRGCFAPANHSTAVPLKIVSVWLSHAHNAELKQGCEGVSQGVHPTRPDSVPLSQGCPSGTVLRPDYANGCVLYIHTRTPNSGGATVHVEVEATCTSHAAWPCDSQTLTRYSVSPQHPMVVRLTLSQVLTLTAPSFGGDSTPPESPTSSPPPVDDSPPVETPTVVETTSPTDSET
ncbi:hypothetical protein AB0I98_22745 [Streptomyces sp. NPDC050211]|uniref:hypothetical protein n=1 Tax=Streptomyces sp. NPDC050211 TaxID=3154932 RepID=UPI00342D6936